MEEIVNDNITGIKLCGTVAEAKEELSAAGMQILLLLSAVVFQWLLLGSHLTLAVPKILLIRSHQLHLLFLFLFFFLSKYAMNLHKYSV